MNYEMPYRAEIIILLSKPKENFEIFDHIDFDEHQFENKDLLTTLCVHQMKHILDKAQRYIKERDWVIIKAIVSFRKRKKAAQSFQQTETIPLALHKFEHQDIRIWLDNFMSEPMIQLTNIIINYPQEGIEHA